MSQVPERVRSQWPRTHFLNEVVPDIDGTEVTITGWVHEVRNLGNIAFLKLRDRSGFAQVTLVKDECDAEVFETLTSQQRESVVCIKGLVKSSEQAKMGVEIIPNAIQVLSPAETPLPLGVADKVFADLDTRLDNRFLDLRRPEVHAVFAVRDTILDSCQRQLREEGFIEVHTPKIVATATEGGTDLFPIKYFDRDAYLNQSPQLFKQILMGSGMDRVFEIGPAFRAEKHDTVRHVNEFISIDIEMSFADEEDVMGVLERVIHRMATDIAAKHQDDVEEINQLIKRYNHHIEQENGKINRENKGIKKENKKLKKEGQPLKPFIPLKDKVPPMETVVPELPLPRLTYTECVDIINARLQKMRNEAGDNQVALAAIPADLEWGEDPSLEQFKVLAQEYPGLYYITRWPMSIKPFYVHHYDEEDADPDREESRGFDLMFGHKEITSGAQRVHDLDLLIERISGQGLDPEGFEFYLKPFRYGMPPHAGWGLGVERLMMMFTSLHNIREVILFPRDRNRLVP